MHLSFYILFSLCPSNLTYGNGQHRTTGKAAETVTGIGNPPVKPVCLSVEFSRNLNRGDLYEKITFYRQPDHIHPQASRGRNAGC